MYYLKYKLFIFWNYFFEKKYWMGMVFNNKNEMY